MRFVYVLEDDEKFLRDIVTAILSIDPKIQVRVFRQIAEYANWIKEMTSKGPAAISIGGQAHEGFAQEALIEEAHQLVAVISKIEYLGVAQLPLLKKTREQFIKRKICTSEDPTAFVLTAFEDPQFNHKEIQDRILNNVIYKPFDQLILTQHLTFAIDGRHPPSKYSIANQKATAVVEMLKDVKVEGLSEVGFVTRSDRLLDRKGMVSKYYGAVITADSKISLMAALLDSKPDPKNPKEFICSFSYFGLSQQQISQFRKRQKAVTEFLEYDWTMPREDALRTHRSIGVVIIDEHRQNAKEISETIERRFSSTQIITYMSLTEFLLDLDPRLANQKSAGQAVKAFPGDQEIKLVFDSTGGHIVDFIKVKKDPVVLFGVKEDELKAHQFWMTSLGSEAMAQWKRDVHQPASQVFSISVHGHAFYLKLNSCTKNPTTQNYEILLTELTPDEKAKFLIAKSKIPKVTDLIFVSHRFIQPEESESWNRIKASLKDRAVGVQPNLNTSVFVVASRDYSDLEFRQLGGFVNDILYRPIDRVYLAQKIKLFIPELKPGSESVSLTTTPIKEEISIANPVPISEISEAGMVLQYYRAMSLGAFRGFILWQPWEISATRLVGTCNFTEQSGQKGIYNNHFVFFGVTDHFLKAIRIWIRDHYILSKEQGS